MRKRRLVSLLLAASLAASALAGCGSGGKTAETTAAGQGAQERRKPLRQRQEDRLKRQAGQQGRPGRQAGPARLTLGHHWRMSG